MGSWIARLRGSKLENRVQGVQTVSSSSVSLEETGGSLSCQLKAHVVAPSRQRQASSHCWNFCLVWPAQFTTGLLTPSVKKLFDFKVRLCSLGHLSLTGNSSCHFSIILLVQIISIVYCQVNSKSALEPYPLPLTLRSLALPTELKARMRWDLLL